MKKISVQLKQYLIDHFALPAEADDDTTFTVLERKFSQKQISLDKIRELQGVQKAAGSASFEDLIGSAGDDGAATGPGNIRVKKASERYCSTKSAGEHVRTGRPVIYEGATVQKASQLDLAFVGAWFKHFARSNGQTLAKWGMPIPDLTEHDQQLLAELYHEKRFCGLKSNGDWVGGKTIGELGLDVKSLLNDATSGGQSLVPFEFDEAVITYPLLNGELFPFVDLKETGRDEVQTAAISNPTVSWSTSEGTEIPLFDTDALVSNITATVFPVSVAVEYGKDLEADSPVALGQILVEQIGQVMLQELDDVIANGDGTTQPEGIFNASGTIGVNSENDTTGPPIIDDYESLMFAVGKQYRRADWNPSFIANDTSYQRVRSIPVSSSSDARRVFGLDHQSYMLLEHKYRIQNSIANSKVAFCALKKYRMWRRAGFEPFFTDQGKELARKNQKLLVIRGRYAGLLTDTNACAVMEDAQS